jgi:hypothetical protein
MSMYIYVYMYMCIKTHRHNTWIYGWVFFFPLLNELKKCLNLSFCFCFFVLSLTNYFCGLYHRQGADGEIKDPVAARKVQKADREKLRRDRLNEQFLELGNSLGKLL